MVVEVDDAGWGDLIGGAFIVMRRTEPDERFTGEVPLSAFQGPAFQEKAYFSGVMAAVQKGIGVLKVDKSERLRICTGYILSGVRAALVNEGYTVEPARITGATQEYAEEQFVMSLVRLGVGSFSEVKAMRSLRDHLEIAWGWGAASR